MKFGGEQNEKLTVLRSLVVAPLILVSAIRSWVAGSLREVSGNLYPGMRAISLNLSGRLRIYTYPGIRAKGWKSFLAVYPGRTSLSGQTNPGKKSHPGIRAKPGHPGYPLESAGTGWYQLGPAGTSWYPAGTS